MEARPCSEPSLAPYFLPSTPTIRSLFTSWCLWGLDPPAVFLFLRFPLITRPTGARPTGRQRADMGSGNQGS